MQGMQATKVVLFLALFQWEQVYASKAVEWRCVIGQETKEVGRTGAKPEY